MQFYNQFPLYLTLCLRIYLEIANLHNICYLIFIFQSTLSIKLDMDRPIIILDLSMIFIVRWEFASTIIKRLKKDFETILNPIIMTRPLLYHDEVFTTMHFVFCFDGHENVSWKPFTIIPNYMLVFEEIGSFSRVMRFVLG